MTDYYEVLGLSRQAEDDEIAKAYRRYAMAYNPQCHPDDPDQKTLQHKFSVVSQAYTVLSDSKIRAIYDLYGEEGVRHGGTGAQGIPGGLDVDAIDPNTVFKRFFGVDNPFQLVGEIDGVQNNQHDFFSQVAALPKAAPKYPTLQVTLPITIEDVFYGATRRAVWQSMQFDEFGANVTTSESYELVVRKGAKTGDHFNVAGLGNSARGYSRGDVCVVLQLQPHKVFRREGDDLVVVVPISLSEALCGTTITVHTMEGRALSVLIDEIVHPKYRRRIAGEGLPRATPGSSARGDLIIECDTKFPSFLTLEQKSELRRILDAKEEGAAEADKAKKA